MVAAEFQIASFICRVFHREGQPQRLAEHDLFLLGLDTDCSTNATRLEDLRGARLAELRDHRDFRLWFDQFVS